MEAKQSFQHIDDLVEGIFNFMQTGKDYLGPTVILMKYLKN